MRTALWGTLHTYKGPPKPAGGLLPLCTLQVHVQLAERDQQSRKPKHNPLGHSDFTGSPTSGSAAYTKGCPRHTQSWCWCPCQFQPQLTCCTEHHSLINDAIDCRWSRMSQSPASPVERSSTPTHRSTSRAASGSAPCAMCATPSRPSTRASLSRCYPMRSTRNTAGWPCSSPLQLAGKTKRLRHSSQPG